MGRVIAVANQKGGVGKTTTAINLSACLAEKGQKVLAIDMDPQGNMTSGLGIDKDEVEKNIYDLMIGQAGVDEVLQKEAIENLDVIPMSQISMAVSSRPRMFSSSLNVMRFFIFVVLSFFSALRPLSWLMRVLYTIFCYCVNSTFQFFLIFFASHKRCKKK